MSRCARRALTAFAWGTGSEVKWTRGAVLGSHTATTAVARPSFRQEDTMQSVEPVASRKFLRKSWYVAAFSEELVASRLLARTILSQPVLLYRGDSGAVAAIGNLCPHRFAPLSMGELVGNQVRCAYHGLGFDGSGRCVHNPHGAKGALSVPSFPTVEQDGLVWIWMGEAALADPAAVPKFPRQDPDRYHIGYGYLQGSAHYELMSDNILDLSHIEFLHPALGTEAVSKAKVVVDEGPGCIVATRRMTAEVLHAGLAAVYGTGQRPVNRTMAVSWAAPANLTLTVEIETADDGDPWQSGSQSLHLFTPETDRTSHYFYVASLDRDKADERTAGIFFEALRQAFTTEDKPIIEAQAALIGAADIMELKPALLPIDKANVLARRRLARMIAEEDGSAAERHAQ
jgi:phenylpropionate dioxygenase-like ring-hydroxylating dioxygenase large terminal subunit